MNQHFGHLVGTHNQIVTLQSYMPKFWFLAQQHIAFDNHLISDILRECRSYPQLED
jgi:tryptophanyl-tRNA synthetase